eukprot:150548-Karenia_brevis.AAC.1
MQRLERLHAVMTANRLDGRRHEPVEFWDTLRARSELKSGSGAGIDGNTSDVFKQLPILSVLHIHKMFVERASFAKTSPSS